MTYGTNNYCSSTATDRCWLEHWGLYANLILNFSLDTAVLPNSTSFVAGVFSNIHTTGTYLINVPLQSDMSKGLVFTLADTTAGTQLTVANYMSTGSAPLGFYRTVIPVMLSSFY